MRVNGSYYAVTSVCLDYTPKELCYIQVVPVRTSDRAIQTFDTENDKTNAHLPLLPNGHCSHGTASAAQVSHNWTSLSYLILVVTVTAV